RAAVVGDDEHRHAERRLVAPPAVGHGIVLPRAAAAAEHAAAHDDGAHARDLLADRLVVDAGLAAGLAVPRAPGRRVVRPLVEPSPASPERVLDGRVRAGDEPIERGGDVDDGGWHLLLLCAVVETETAPAARSHRRPWG